MQWVRRHRHRFLLVFMLGAVGAMTYGYLKRIGFDPLAAFRDEDAEDEAPVDDDCQPVDFDGMCTLEGVTPLSGQGGLARLRATYRLVDGPRGARTDRTIEVRPQERDRIMQELQAATPIQCRGVWFAHGCESPPFHFGE